MNAPRRRWGALALALTLCAGCDLDAVERLLFGRVEPPRPASTAPSITPYPSATPSGGVSVHLALGAPVDASPQDELMLVKPQYVVSYNRFRNAPNWVAWRLTAADLGDTGRTRRTFSPDPQLPSGVYRVVHRDYAGGGYDHGHLCPSAQRTATVEDNAATFLTTNMLPQRHAVNAGAWENLERWTVERAREGWDLFIVAGGVWPRECATDLSPAGNTVSEGCESLGRSPDLARRVAVPESTWKVVVMVPRGRALDAVTAQTAVVAVDMPNVPGGVHDWRRFSLSVDALEARTGYDFNTLVPQAVQAQIEARAYDGR